MSVADELKKLRDLHRDGGLSDAEYEHAKGRLLNHPADPEPVYDDARHFDSSGGPKETTADARQWAMILHLSQLAGYILVPVVGWIAPILIWQMKKDQWPSVDQHGKIVANWLLSYIIYFIVCIPLMLLLVGIPLLIGLVIVGIIFPIIGGLKANSGELWRYPLSIPFFK